MIFPESSPQNHRAPDRIGVLLINLGTPDAPTAEALRPYLKQFLSNRRVVELPQWLWWPILNGIILNTRPKQSAEKYAQIWMPEGSPLKVHTERQAELTRIRLAERLPNPPTLEYAMSIGSPSIADVLRRMKEGGCERILILPLYPQYASSSTASAFDEVFAQVRKMRDMPALRTVKHYHDHPGYITALAQNVRDYWAEHGTPDKLVLSFHGVPRSSVDAGDPYQDECLMTGKLVAKALQLDSSKYEICFQSRFGRAEWLTPYTALTLERLGKENIRRVDVLCPGFVSDCLETLEEIAMEGKAIFIQAGGQDFHYIPCLNEREDWIGVLVDIILTHLQGWLEPEATAGGTDSADIKLG